ncbi:STAS domain-containing protein [Devosia sp.]|uniref:STAS domain-containing protein n=1 Tax=Devosia sp. TaxID=1871048 RepID=UPI001AC21AD1|nr:STAS domain-containing protein [Devosia sp.]MBN9332597.1 STAS domain-containing protein [Devosia sp.]
MILKCVVVTLPPLATIGASGDVTSLFRDALAQADEIEVISSDVLEADLTLVQLLLAARRFAEKNNKSIRLCPPSRPFKDVLRNTGLLAGRDAGFWMGAA